MITKIIRRVILAVTLVFTFIFLLTHYDKNEYSRENLEAYVQRMGKLYDVQGLSAAIIDGENEYFINYGNDKKKPIDENSRFELASTTK
ncbi:MAG: serine hydrolase, partial [Treponema sp.]|nr:serine hydrolase [Treponema sp.]